MNDFIKALQTKASLTENGAVTNSTSFNKVLGFFSVAGNRNRNCKTVFYSAFGENPTLALKALFWPRDCRGDGFQRCFGERVLSCNTDVLAQG